MWEASSFCLGNKPLCFSQEAIEKKEQRAKRFHFRAEVNLTQRNVALDRDVVKKGMESSGEVALAELLVPSSSGHQIVPVFPLTPFGFVFC